MVALIIEVGLFFGNCCIFHSGNLRHIVLNVLELLLVHVVTILLLLLRMLHHLQLLVTILQHQLAIRRVKASGMSTILFIARSKAGCVDCARVLADGAFVAKLLQWHTNGIGRLIAAMLLASCLHTLRKRMNILNLLQRHVARVSWHFNGHLAVDCSTVGLSLIHISEPTRPY